MDVELRDEKLGRLGDKSIGDAEGHRFLRKLRKLVQRRARGEDSGQPGNSTKAKTGWCVNRGDSGNRISRCRKIQELGQPGA
jgi:hypothetical protein